MAENTKAKTNGHAEEGAFEIIEVLTPTDGPRADPCPRTIGKFWIEHQTDEAEAEQHDAYTEQAEREAAPAKKTSAELIHKASRAKEASDRADGLAAGETGRFEGDLTVLHQHCRRRVHAALVYWLAGLFLLLGDVAGGSGAILILGEQILNAVAQASSVAVSAVLLGGVGTAVRHWVAAKARQKPYEDLIPEERDRASFFAGPGPYRTAVKVLAPVFVAGAVTIVVGIFTLRNAAQGEEVAIAFACFAAALCLASFVRSYEYACEVSDYLASGYARLRKFERNSGKAAAHPVIPRHAGADAEATSIVDRNGAAARAAARGLRRDTYGVLNEQPEIAGHGTAPDVSKRRPGDSEGGGREEVAS